MAKKTKEDSIEEVVIDRKAELKQKLEDSLNGKCIFDAHDLKEVLQYL